MTERESIHGAWWLPNDPDERWTGVLSLVLGESPSLKVSVPKGFFSLPAQTMELTAIHGCDECGKPITLLSASRPSSQGGAALTQLEFSAALAIIGIELPNAASFQVNSVSLRLQHLYE